MAAPTVVARTEDNGTSASTTLDIAFTQTTGDLVVIFISTAQSTALSSISDSFVNLTSVTANFHVIYKVLTGSEGGNVTMSVTSTKFCSIAYNIQGHSTSINPEISVVATGTSTGPNPDTVTPAAGFAKNFLWLAAFYSAGEEADDDTWCTAAPTDFTNLVQKTTGTGGTPATNSSIAAANYTSSATSMNPAAFTQAQSLAWRAYTVAISPAPTATISGTITASVNETDIVTGGKTSIITIGEDRWVASGGTFDGQRDEIIAGHDSAQSEATGWDAVPKASQSLGGVVRTSDTVCTVTWDAFASYNITATETITVTVPSTALLGGMAATGSPTFAITAVVTDVFFENRHNIEGGMKPNTAAAMSGVLVE